MSVNPYRRALAILGLDRNVAAELHGRTVETVKKYMSGHRAVPDSCWAQLYELYDQQQTIRKSNQYPRRDQYISQGAYENALMIWAFDQDGMKALEFVYDQITEK